jgi:maltose alpha-D-glucosyltransferase/alpha-amylase
MGDNIYLGDRNGVRTPMQWTSDRNGGFSRCDPARLYLPVIMDPVYGHQSVNVEAQQRSPSSFLNWMRRLIGVRRSTHAFSRGTLSFVRPGNRTVICYVREYENDTILCVANLSRSAQAAQLDLSPWKGRVPLEMLGRAAFPRIGDEPYVVTLAPYGFFWFQLSDPAEPPAEMRTVPRETITLVWASDRDSPLAARERHAFERDVLPHFLLERRWFAEKAHGLPNATLDAIIPVERDGVNAALTLVNVPGEQGATSRYLLPLTVAWTRFDRSAAVPANAIAAIRRGRQEGTLIDAGTDPGFVRLLLDAMRGGQTLAHGNHRIESTPTTAFVEMPIDVDKIAAPNREQSNTTVIVGTDCVLKIFRKLNEGVHPEIEIGRFLIEQTQYRNVPALLGSIELVEGEQRSALAVAHSFIENQGDAWTVTEAYLGRFIDDQRVPASAASEESPELAAYLGRIKQIGRRTGELQTALASRPDIDAFAPEPVGAEDVVAWTERLIERSTRTLDLLEQKRGSLAEAEQNLTERILTARPAIVEHIRHSLPGSVNAVKVRHHGDFHLGQVLVAKDDAFILDFEGEPGRSLADRRAKAPAARDVAGLIRSIDYSTTSALLNAVNLTPEERNILVPKLELWRDKAVEAFWAACRQATDPALWPADATEAQNLLDFFLLEKAFYEMEYELMNRPAWLHVPLDGTWRILKRHSVVQS